MTDAEDRDRMLADSAVGFYRETLDWLAHHHAGVAKASTHDLDADDRWSAVWKLSGTSIGHGYALVEMLSAGFTGQTWAMMRSVHEVNRLLAAVTNLDEERIPRRWLADQEVKQSAARKAEQAEAQRISEQMQKAGLDALPDVGGATREIYKQMSKAAHHQRSIVDEAVDAEARTMVYGPDPSSARRLAFATYAGALLHEVLLLVGGALALVWGPGFYAEHLKPMLASMEDMLSTLDFIEVARRLGFG
jgi:hypothetical protein